MATFNFYFSFATGNDTTGNGSEGSPWKTHTKMGSIVASKASGDIVNLYLKRGDTWQINTVSSTLYHILFPSTGPKVNVNAYGTNPVRPIIDGMVSNWSAVPYDGVGGVRRYNTVFRTDRNDCSVRNLEVKNCYGHATFVNRVSGFSLTGNLIHNFGNTAVTGQTGPRGEESGAIAAYNVIHTGQMLRKYDKRDWGWEGAINILTASSTNPHHIHHNIIYDICGEGIITSNSICEWNLVGDTGSIGISNVPHDFNAYASIIRYNFILHSSDFSSWDISGQGPTAMRMMTELLPGSNSDGTFDYYGNVIINRSFGLHQHINHAKGADDPFKWAKVYNNLFIDCTKTNFGVYDPDNYLDYVNVYSNSSLLIKRVSGLHAQDGGTLPHSDWSITGNHFWTKGAATPTVPTAWKGNWNIANPQLLGQDTVNWTGLTGATYYKSVNPINHLNPPSSSPIYGLSPLLAMDIDIFVATIENYHLTGQDPGEYIPPIASDPVEIHYSVSPFGTGDLKTGSPTVTITEGYAVLSVVQTGNIGAGDRITYDTDKIGYIYRIYSPTELDIRTAVGGVPADITDSTVVSIKHEYAAVTTAIAGAKDANHLNATDLVTGKIKLKLACYYDHDDGTGEVNAFTFSGYTQSADYQIELYAPTGIPYSLNRQANRGEAKATPDYFWCAGGISFIVNSIPHTIMSGIDFQSDADEEGAFIQATEKLIIKNSIIRNEQLSTEALYGLWVRNLSTSTVPGISLENVTVSGFSGNVLFQVTDQAAQNMVNDFNCVVFYAEQAGSRALISSVGTNTKTVNFNVFNSQFFADTGTLYDWGTYDGTWNIHNSIFSDNLHAGLDGSAHGCLATRTATDNPSPGAGDFVVFMDITSAIKDLRLVRSSDNDAYDMHSDGSGAGLTIPDYDIAGNLRSAPYCCGPYDGVFTQPDLSLSKIENPVFVFSINYDGVPIKIEAEIDETGGTIESEEITIYVVATKNFSFVRVLPETTDSRITWSFHNGATWSQNKLDLTNVEADVPIEIKIKLTVDNSESAFVDPGGGELKMADLPLTVKGVI